MTKSESGVGAHIGRVVESVSEARPGIRVGKCNSPTQKPWLSFSYPFF